MVYYTLDVCMCSLHFVFVRVLKSGEWCLVMIIHCKGDGHRIFGVCNPTRHGLLNAQRRLWVMKGVRAKCAPVDSEHQQLRLRAWGFFIIILLIGTQYSNLYTAVCSPAVTT